MQLYYVLPVILIAAVYMVATHFRKRAVAAAQNMSPDQAAARFHDYYRQFFELVPDETIIGAWSGVEFQGAKTATRHLVGALANSVSAAAIGVSTYVPNVQVALTSAGRVLVSREYSDLGKRGQYHQMLALAKGTRGLPAVASLGQDFGVAPKNPFNPSVALEFVELRSPNGEVYQAWMSPQGGRAGQPGFSSILQSLVA